MRKIALALGAAVLVLSACSEAPSGGEPGDTISVYTYTYQGSTLYCVGENADSNFATLSCDFHRYYAENPEKLLSPQG